MTAVNSEMIELGTLAPEFSLPDPDGNMHKLGSGADAYLVMFICNHCPFVKHMRNELARLGNEYQSRNTAVFAINSNDFANYPDDSPEKMRHESIAAGYKFPYLIDGDQSVAKAYNAACTPDFYVFDADKKLIYRGQLDDSRPSNRIPVNGIDLRTALDAQLRGDNVPAIQKPSIGCNIKWKPGNSPDYFG